MSLISDALKTAERQQRSRAGAPAEHPFFDGYFPHSVGLASSRSRRFVFGAGAILIAGAVTSLGVIRLRAEPASTPHVARQASVLLATPRAARREPAAGLDSSVSSVVGPSAPRVSPQAGGGKAPALQRATPSASARVASIARARPRADSVVAAAVDPASQPVAAPAQPGVQITVDAGAPRPVDAIMTQALAAQRQGNLAAAKDLYDRAIKVGPVSAALYNNYGALLHDMGNSRDAVAMLRLSLSLDQTFTSGWVNLGNAEDAIGDRGAAVSAYNQALKLDPSNRDSKVGLAWQYIQIGSFLDARRLLADVLRASPDFPLAHYALGQALEGDHDRSGAAREFSRFLDLGGASAKQGLDAEVRAHVTALNKPE